MGFRNKLENHKEIELWKTTAKSLISKGDWNGYQEYRRAIHCNLQYLRSHYNELKQTENCLIHKVRSLIGVKGKKTELAEATKNRRDVNAQIFIIGRKILLLIKTQLELREHSSKKINEQFDERFTFDTAIVFENKKIGHQRTKQVSIRQEPTFIETFPTENIISAEFNV